ncbi:dihydroxyacetone kinase family protein [Planctomonas deserti]|uniref:dihydroxyacetone kinase family protein n=1 Tax=Planctomonas deserti TaxID=2144185 RepID=UPI000D3971E7|nr:dihydroxyacetone kinase family protein [Planctomonas deserti]
MTRLFNDPTAFADELVEGFVAANRRWVRRVEGGVARRQRTPEGQVAVVIGGGSGHYPAFGGLVGPGLAHGAAMGNLFASPSSQQVYAVAKAAENGGGVFLSYGNYAGDVLNFDTAQQRLNDEGIPCRTVTVTDDISSAPVDEISRRRGIAGDLTVFKVAGAAAAEGADLEEVVRVATLANDRTRSIGVAFSGCTLPGADAPLFEVPEGRMAVGLGIHGEPGISETDVPTADGLAELFVTSLLNELPPSVEDANGQRAAVILNGLGTVKYEELFVVYRSVARLLEEAGVTVVEPEVGELVTSFDMAGASLTILWLDDELERLWSAPTDTPAYRKGSVGAATGGEEFGDDAADALDDEGDSESAALPEASPASRAAASVVTALLETLSGTMDEHADELGRIDSVAGDGDHGIGMQRGASAALGAAKDALARDAGAGTVLTRAGDAWSNRAGGTSGALWGLALTTLGTRIGDDRDPAAADIAEAVQAAVDAIRGVGKAEVGDKTMVDAIVPFAARFREELDRGSAPGDALAAAALAATEAAAATSDLMPRMGRARPHAEKSLGSPDPGAHSFALIVTAIADALPTVAAQPEQGTS